MPKLPGTRPRSPHFADRAYTPHWVRRELGPLLPIAVPFHVRAPYRAHRRGSIAGDGIRRQPSVAPTNRCCSASKRGYDGNPGFERCAGGAAETAGIEPFSRSLSWPLPWSLPLSLSWPPAAARGHARSFASSGGRGSVHRQFRDAVIFCARRARRPRTSIEAKLPHHRGRGLRSGRTHDRSKPSCVPRKACAQNARDWTDHSGVRPQPEAKPALPGFHGLSFEELRAFGRQALQIAAPHGAALPVSGRSWQAAEARCLC